MAGASGPVHVQGLEKLGKRRRWIQRGICVGVGIHQGFVLSPLLFIIVLEALSREFHTGYPWQLLYANNLMICAESMEELLSAGKVVDMEIRNGEEGRAGEHGEYKDYDVRH